MERDTVEQRRGAWERDLVARMRRDEPDAFLTFFRSFRPLLMAEARRLRVQPGLWQELVDECLDDVAMQFRQYTTPIPRELRPYLVKALRLRRYQQLRGERRRIESELDAVHDATLDADDRAMAVAGSVSEAALRDSAGPDYEPTAASTALERLVSMLEEGLSADEEMLLSWMSRWVSHTIIAEWLGITHGAARNRTMRLRARLKEAAMQHAVSFTGHERVELMDFFRRTFRSQDQAGPTERGPRPAA